MIEVLRCFALAFGAQVQAGNQLLHVGAVCSRFVELQRIEGAVEE